MSRAKRPIKSDSAESEDYERFEALAKALVSVPKAEILAEAEKHEKAKKKACRTA